MYLIVMNHTHDQVFPALLSDVQKHEKSTSLPPDRTTRSLKGRQFQDVLSSQSGPVYLLLKLNCKFLSNITMAELKKQVHKLLVL